MQTNQKQDRKLILIGLLAALVYWVLETNNFLNMNPGSDFTQALITPSVFTIAIRLTVVLMILGFSTYASGLLNQETTEKLKLDQLLKSKDHTLATASSPIIELNPSLRMLNINKATARLTGINADDITMANVIATLFYKEDHDAVEKALQPNQKVDLGVIRVRTKLGRPRYVTLSTAFEYSEDQLEKIYLILNDVSQILDSTDAVVENVESDVQDSDKLTIELENELEKEKKQKKALELEIAILKQYQNENENKITALESERDQLIKEYNQTKAKLDTLKKTSEQLEQEKETLLKEQKQANEAYAILKEELQAIPAQITNQETAASIDSERLEIDILLKELELKRDQNSAVLNNIDDGIIITDLYNRITMMNPAAEDIFGVRLSQVLERPIHFLIQEPFLLEQMQKTLNEGLRHNKFELQTRSLEHNQPIHLDVKSIMIRNRFWQGEAVLLVFRKSHI